jgi:hypothetical protein
MMIRMAAAVGLIAVAVLPGAATQNAQGRLDRAKAALGGAAELSAVKALRLRGTSSAHLIGPKSRGGKLGPLEVERLEIRILLPDRFVVRSEPAGPAAPDAPLSPAARRWGIVGDAAIGETVVARSQEHLGYLILGLLLRTDTIHRFELADASANALRFRNPAGNDVHVELDPATGLPTRIRFQYELRRTNGDPSGERVEKRYDLNDYRPVGKLRLAHQVVETIGDRPNPLTYTFARIEVNPPLTAADFK